ncbi:oligopeptide transport system ATP-binding protein [Spinactinospora alkalitolerans]|uniref:Oligopeptide transport system ATP-binding protein n=1 Tax=Spinactinospora alkalitolerans TaxID=687207 RepID=A0A852TW78_9ACTN|nr:ABC transporter ATP-binding protein [Spinactinospora alkalitolerans]NYE47981.1 oligopeptide transport system ATP-binding protein [Spinactinospora alkalitolerans]
MDSTDTHSSAAATGRTPSADSASAVETVARPKPRHAKRNEPLLRVDGLRVRFQSPFGTVNAVNGVDLTLNPGETLGILGESGSGKSITAQAIMGLVPSPPGEVSGNGVYFKGQNLLGASGRKLRRVRGKEIAMVFQDSISSLNPGFTVGRQIAEMFRLHEGASRRESLRRAVEMIERVGIPSPEVRAGHYPHQFSGGMSQRIMIATALALRPAVVIADEPTTALDVTVQAQIMALLKQLQEETGMGLILITHDLHVLAEVADRVTVMYAGRVVETGTLREIYDRPRHPYTAGLMRCVPGIRRKEGSLQPIAGQPPVLTHIPNGCAFHPRCPLRVDECTHSVPRLRTVSSEHSTACIRHEEIDNAG